MALLGGCSSNGPRHLAPVTDGWRQAATNHSVYHVQKGDTLYSIAWAFGRDYRYLAKINRLHVPYALRVGQPIAIVDRGSFCGKKNLKIKPIEIKSKVVYPLRGGTAQPIAGEQKNLAVLRIPERGHITEQKNVEVKGAAKIKVVSDVPNRRVKVWYWPAKGKVVGEFHQLQGGNKGINIAGKFGAPIYASAGGKVVYSGNGLRGYGNLIIIKHNESYLSAYAYCKKILVSEGQLVKSSQIIASMGRSLNGQTMLHFEIRRNGQPVSPIRYLKPGLHS